MTAKLGFCELLKRAAEVLEQEAQCLRESHTVKGKWRGEYSKDARADYTELRDLAKALRRASKYAKPNPMGGPAAIFDACADAIRAGEPVKSAMADYGLRFSKERP
jgi:hypothetical protein